MRITIIKIIAFMFQEWINRYNRYAPRPEDYGSTYARDSAEFFMELAEQNGLSIKNLGINPPKIVCLCGSTRFKSAFERANFEETMKGNIVLSVGFFVHGEGYEHGETMGCTEQEKIALDALHKRKIDLADEVLVLNVDGYIGSSTRSEISYAVRNEKPLRYLEEQS
jgi:hypothetical protein